MTEVWKTVLHDFSQPAGYLFPAIVISVLARLLWRIGKKKRKCRKYSWKQWGFQVVVLAYVLILIQTAIFSRAPGSRAGMSMRLLETWGSTAKAHAFFIENILMFVPFGILFPVVFDKLRRMWQCVLIGFICSCGIELIQLATQRGYCQLDDIVTNTVGCAVGWMVWKAVGEIRGGI